MPATDSTPTRLPALADMTISEVLALLPEGCDWTCIDSGKASVRTEGGSTGSIWWDTQDPTNLGWAYELNRSSGEFHEETGELDDADDLANVFS